MNIYRRNKPERLNFKTNKSDPIYGDPENFQFDIFTSTNWIRFNYRSCNLAGIYYFTFGKKELTFEIRSKV